MKKLNFNTIGVITPAVKFAKKHLVKLMLNLCDIFFSISREITQKLRVRLINNITVQIPMWFVLMV
jgi:hypothetical protein